MSILQGLVTGTLGYEQKKEFLSNSFMFRTVETFNYEIYSVDFSGMSQNQIQNQIKNQFSQIYSGDIQVKVFSTAHAFQYPTDSIRAAKYNVSVEAKQSLSQTTLAAQFPELESGNYKGIDSTFWSNYGKYILDFKEDFSFSTTSNGTKEFGHNLSFGLQTGWVGGSTANGRKVYAQSIASGIFGNDKNIKETNGNFGIVTMIGEITGLGDSGLFRNYYSESYDLLKNSYSFARRRETRPYSSGGSVYNLNHSINLNEDGTIDISEKAEANAKIDFSLVKRDLELFSGGAYSRCRDIYNQFYDFNNNTNNAKIILSDSQYSSSLPVTLLPLINTPTKINKNYDVNQLLASYDISYTNNPTYSSDSTVTSQTFEFSVGEYGTVDAIHSFDYIVNRVVNSSGYYTTLFANTTGQSPVYASQYYLSNYAKIKALYPNLNLIKATVDWPNIKTKATAKLYYSNNPTYFQTTNGVAFKVLDYKVDKKLPPDIINEYKIINRPNHKSILSYGYQSEKGEISISIRASVGKNSSQFYPDGVGGFSLLNGSLSLSDYLQALYKFGGQVFLAQFNFPTVAFNWFISDSRYTLDSEGEINVTLNYTYTLKKRYYENYK